MYSNRYLFFLHRILFQLASEGKRLPPWFITAWGGFCCAAEPSLNGGSNLVDRSISIAGEQWSLYLPIVL